MVILSRIITNKNIFGGAIFDENKRLQIVNCRLTMLRPIFLVTTLGTGCYGINYGIIWGKLRGFSGYLRAGDDSMSKMKRLFIERSFIKTRRLF